jgi:hypothetical protein
MSKLYASIDSDARKTQATSRGHHDLSAHVRGWDLGIETSAHVRPDNGRVEIRVWITGGSNAARSQRLLAVVTEENGDEPFIELGSGVLEEVVASRSLERVATSGTVTAS